MNNGIYIALSRQMALFRDMDVTSNNMANVNTTGYAAEKLMFDDYLVKGGQGPRLAYVNDFGSYRDESEGIMKATGNPLDVAISGRGYFVVQTPLGERYTRAGNFQLNTDGVLVTAEGHPVLDEAGGEIIFEPQDRDIAIGEAGDIVVDGEPRVNLGIVEFANPQLMERVGSTMYSAAAGSAEPAVGSRILHGVLEGANVQPVRELTHLIKLSRSVGGTAKLLDAQYEMVRKSSDTWAKTQ